MVCAWEPVPITVRIRPSAATCWRRADSRISTFPAASSTTPAGSNNGAVAATAPCWAVATAALPASVAMMPEESTLRTRWVPVSAIRRRPPPSSQSADGLDSSRSEEHTSELQSLRHLACRLLLEKTRKTSTRSTVGAHRSDLYTYRLCSGVL